MKQEHRDQLEQLWSYAEGKEDTAIAALVARDPEAAAIVAEMKRLIATLDIGVFQAPDRAIRQVKALFQPDVVLGRPLSRARLVLSTLQGAMARSAVTEEFQIQFEAEGVDIRLMYTPDASGWEVMGRVEGQAEEVRRRGEAMPMTDGRFEFRAASLEETDFSVLTDQSVIEVPAAHEALGHGRP